MKVMQVLPELNSGGVERGTLEVAEFLVKEGHEAVVVSNGGRLVEELVNSGARHIAMPVHKKSLRSLLQVRSFRRLLEDERPDILHIRSRLPGWISFLAWRKMDPSTRPRLVSTVHGFYSVNRYSEVMTKGERVIAVSGSVEEYISRSYPQTDMGKIRVIHRGIDQSSYHPGFTTSSAWMEMWNCEYPEAVDRILLLMPGRLSRWKGQEDFIRIVAGLAGEGLDVHGMIAGEAHPEKRMFPDELWRLAKSLGIGDRISFCGHRADLREIMSISRIVFSLSSDPEAFGRVSLEALALGRPVVAYGHGGVAEQMRIMLPQGLVPPGDLTHAIDRAREFIRAAQPPGAADEFSLMKMLRSTLDTYESVLRKNRIE